MNKNPAKGGYLCTLFKIDSQGAREERKPFVVVAKNREEAAALVQKAVKVDKEYDRFSLIYISIFS